jgi:hypothetical protein
MPERLPTTNPTVIAGTPLLSGTPNTGQLLYTQGGAKVYTKLSGVVGPDNLIHVGGGRLDAAFFHDSALIALSGQAVVFYDASAAVSGGPLTNPVVGVLAPGPQLGGTGISGAALRGGIVSPFGFTYQSGLCASTRSGQAGWSASYTPVVSN